MELFEVTKHLNPLPSLRSSPINETYFSRVSHPYSDRSNILLYMYSKVNILIKLN